jgi:hypothetical protein
LCFLQFININLHHPPSMEGIFDAGDSRALRPGIVPTNERCQLERHRCFDVKPGADVKRWGPIPPRDR